MNRIELTNFRVFKETTSFDLAPITILTGKNNSGKSSLIKSFILLSDYMEPDSNQLILDLNGKQAHKHKINKFYNVKNWSSNSKEVAFQYSVDEYTYSLKFSGHTEESYARLDEFSIYIDTINDSLLLNRNSDRIFQLRVSQSFIDYLGASKSTNPIDIDTYVMRQELITQKNQIDIELAEIKKITKNMKELSIEMTPIILKQQELERVSKLVRKKLSISNSEHEKKGNVVYNTEILIENEGYTNITLSTIIRRALMNYADELRTSKDRLNPDISKSFYKFFDRLSQRMSEYSYHLGPNRTYQARLYTKGNTDSEINEILTHYVLSKVQQVKSAVHFLNKWLHEFELGEELKTELYEGVAIKVTILRNGSWINIVNIGFGSGQLLTILLKVTSIIADQNKLSINSRTNVPIVLIEEPEANLHPRLQSRLADMFLDASKKHSLRFVLETHSEYMIRRLQLLVATDSCKIDDAIIYYMDQQKIKKLQFQLDGKLSDSFGEGFFDEADSEAMELYRVQKRKSLRK